MEVLNIVIVLAIALIVTLYKGINIVPQGEEWIVERLGKFSRTLTPGLNLIIPYIETIRERVSTRDLILDIPEQEVITKDNAVIHTNAVSQTLVMRSTVSKISVLQYSSWS